ncbi:uncharacterized protein isoform X1 [Leptinotarsa decemlineata]|uniref:uncharacterized protein isoform X1 n=1 Tax=Leptinotarsa decemlineata TaxID=7539 RepID=UPI003D30A476
MSSIKKKFLNDPVFDIDPISGAPDSTKNSIETKSRRMVELKPLHLFGDFKVPAEKSCEKKTKKTVELKPLQLKLEDFKEPEAKLRKTESNSVRKGLFTITNNRSAQGGRSSLNKRNSAARKKLNKKVQINKKINPVELSPLMNLEEVEEEFLNKKASLRGYPFKSPAKPVLNFTRNNLNMETKTKKCMVPQVIVEEPSESFIEKEPDITEVVKMEEPKTPDSASSNEFLKLEQMCFTEEMRDLCKESPISSMCNLLSDTGLSSTKKSKVNPYKESNVAINIKNIIQSEEIAFNQYRVVHEGNMKKLFHILSSLEKKAETISEVKTPDKENNPNRSNRRSVRLQNKSPHGGNNEKLLISPSILRSGDLRKSTLKKNLAARNQDLNNQSPRTRRAFNLYNTLREKHSILETPKLDRKALAETPNMGRYISMKVQNQCLLLQDTPVHK